MSGPIRRARVWWHHRSARCEHCGHPFRWRRDALHVFPNGERRVYHGPCLAAVQHRRAADETLRVLATVVDVTGVTGRDITAVVEMRHDDPIERSRAANEVFRVFHALEAVRS